MDGSPARYVLDSDAEMRRLDEQATLYDVAAEVDALALAGDENVLDAGCGSGVYARAMAARLPRGRVTGVDAQQRYVDDCARRAAEAGETRTRFETGDLCSLPFADGTFDLVWSKHVIQFVPDRERAVAELVRVVRPGGRVVLQNLHGIFTDVHPVEIEVQSEIDRWFAAAAERVGVDPWVGSKLYTLMAAAGLVDLAASASLDPVHGGAGRMSPLQRANFEQQWAAARPLTIALYGSEPQALQAERRFLAYYDRPLGFRNCILHRVEGRKPPTA
jgi:ubiquinone/menaquinone biosynthesis C-methylase UbiE